MTLLMRDQENIEKGIEQGIEKGTLQERRKSAIHALDSKSYKRHKDTLANFNKDYVRTEIFPKALGRKIAEAEEICHASDYDDFYIATKDEAEQQIQTARN